LTRLLGLKATGQKPEAEQKRSEPGVSIPITRKQPSEYRVH